MTNKYADFEDFVLNDYYSNCATIKDVAIERESEYLCDLDVSEWFELGDKYALTLTK